MVTKKPPTKHGRMNVTFKLVEPEAHSVQLAGDFNGWSERLPLKRLDDGSWSTSIKLDANRTYEYRYFVDEDHWVNEPNADGYASNPFGGENCVLRT